jgi:hypothetical protein
MKMGHENTSYRGSLESKVKSVRSTMGRSSQEVRVRVRFRIFSVVPPNAAKLSDPISCTIDKVK